MASSTSSQGSSNSEPSTGHELGPAVRRRRPSRPRSPRRARTWPAPSSRNSAVVTEKIRSPPSSSADEVRRMSGQVGHGLSPVRSGGGSGMISSWCTLRARWRWTVPRQSAPVSPPPMMTTCLPSRRDRRRVGQRPPGPGWTASGSPWPGGSRPAPGPAPAGPGAGWPRRPAPRRRTRRPGSRAPITAAVAAPRAAARPRGRTPPPTPGTGTRRPRPAAGRGAGRGPPSPS